MVTDFSANEYINGVLDEDRHEFLISACKTYHDENLNQLFSLQDYILLADKSAILFKKATPSYTERFVLIQNEIQAIGLDEKQKCVFLSMLLKHLKLLDFGTLKFGIRIFTDILYKEISNLQQLRRDKSEEEITRVTAKEIVAVNIPSSINISEPFPAVTYDSSVSPILENFRTENNDAIMDELRNAESGDIHFASSLTGYSETYIRKLCRENKIPYSRPCGKYLFSREDILKWRAQNGSQQRHDMIKIGKNRKKS